MEQGSSVDISVVVPVLDEAESLTELHRRLTGVLECLGASFELVFVDDGSTDGSDEILDDLAAADARIGVIHLRRNFGKAAALDAAFHACRGETVITLDADLQDDPDEIPRMLAKLDEGYDVVSGWKAKRRDPIGKTLPSKLFNFVVGRASGLRLHDFNCGFKAYRAEALQNLRLYGELHRYIPVLLYWEGFRIAEIPVNHHPRRYGRSKYGVERLFKGFLDFLTVLLNTRYRARPLHMFGLIGLLLGLAGSIILSYLSVLWLFRLSWLGQRPLLLAGLLLVVVGVQFVSTGLLGELITRSQHADAPAYSIRRQRPARARGNSGGQTTQPRAQRRPQERQPQSSAQEERREEEESRAPDEASA